MVVGKNIKDVCLVKRLLQASTFQLQVSLQVTEKPVLRLRRRIFFVLIFN
jgi:hypothetical protein